MFDSFVPSSGNTWDKSFNSSFTSECGNAEPADAITPGQAIKNIPASGATGEVIDIPPPAPASDFSFILLDTPLQAQADITTNRHERQAVDALTRQALPAAVVGGAISSAHSALAEFASDPDFADKMNLAFGEGWDAAVAGDLAQDWLTGDFSELPPVEIRAGAEINGANGAFAGATNTIYLSSEFVAGNAGSPEAITSVLLEEMGHYIDSRINTSDGAGDEGAIFAGAVQGKEFDAAELQALKAEDDTATVMLDGQAILIEQAANKKADFNGDGKTDFFRQEKAIWDNDNINTANVYLSNGNGTFGKQDLTSTYWDLKGDDGVNIILGDFNGDRKTDFLRQEKGVWDDDSSNTANIFFSNGNGTFWKQDITDHVGMKGDLTNLIVGDYNGDGKDDFIRQEKGVWDDDSVNTAQVYFSNGNGTFWKRDLPDIDEMKGDFTTLIAGDYNGDGKDDFIRQEKGLWDDDSIKTAQVYFSNGNGTFWKQNLPDIDEMKGDFTNLIVGDFNGDRRTDFIRQEKGLWDDDSIKTAQVYFSNGNGTFGKQNLTDFDGMKGDLTNLIVGDYNGDGKEDFIRQEKGLWDDDSIKTAQVYFSNGNGTFWKQDLPDHVEMKGDQTNLITGDFNGDRRTDFIRQEKGDWDNDNSNTANLYLSNSNGTFNKSDLTNDPNSMKGDDGVNIITGGPEMYSATAQIPGTNWKAEYFNNINLTGTPVFVEDLGSGSQNFSRNWGNGAPTNTPSDNFSARMTTQRYLAPGLYKIQAQADDGVRVRVGNQTVIDKWVDQSFVNNSGYFRSNSGDVPVPVTVEYYERGGGAAINFSIAPAVKFQDPVNEQQWRATVYSWNSSQGSPPPTNFWAGDYNNPNTIGVINLGSNTRSDGKKGINANWGTGAPNGDSRLPSDNFAMRAYTWADFDGSPYKFRVRGDDGFQLLAKNQATGQWYNITPANQWSQAYGAHSEITYQLPAGRYDMHFHQYEAGGDASLDLSWEKASNPDIDIRLDFFGNFTQTQKDLIEKAAQNWERIITKDMVSTGILNIAVTQGATTIYGKQWNGPWAETDFPPNYPKGIIATPNIRQNLPTTYDNQRGIDYDTRMHFNSNKLPYLSANSLVALATHEIGHALYLDEAQYDPLLGLDGVMDTEGLDQRITQGIYQRLEYLGYGVDRNATVYWS